MAIMIKISHVAPFRDKVIRQGLLFEMDFRKQTGQARNHDDTRHQASNKRSFHSGMHVKGDK